MNDLIPLNNPNPAALFTAGGLTEILERIETEARALLPDTTTAKGRDTIASTAAKIARSKTYLDGLGKEYVAELKAMPKQIDEQRRQMRERLDALKEEIRAPLTQWEQQQADIANAIEALRIEPNPEATAAELAALKTQLESQAIGERHGNDKQQTEAAAAKLYSLEKLTAALATAIERERQAAEAAAAAAVAAEAARIEREQQIATTAAATARQEAEQQLIEAKHKAEREQQIAERARLEAEQRAYYAERARQIAEERAAEAEKAAAIATEATASQKIPETNAAQVHRLILADLIDAGIPEEPARAVIVAVARGLIAHLTITY